MRHKLLPALVLSVVTGLGGYAAANWAGAQGTPPTQVGTNAPAQDAAAGWAQQPHTWASHGPRPWGARPWLASEERFGHHGSHHGRGWGLFFPQSDKKLTPNDVQTVAEGILLRHGNHAWKVANVAQNQDDTVSFAFTTQGGDVIARFAMDIHTGHVRRIG
jgi:hypothetical protein